MDKFLYRQATLNDLDEMLEVEKATWPGVAYTYSKEQLEDLILTYPEGQVLVVDIESGKIAAMCNAVLVEYDRNLPKSWLEISGQGWAHNIHVTNGSYVYGLNLASNPEFRSNGAGQLALEGLLHVTLRVNATGFYSAVRLPDYHKHQDIPVQQYISTKTADGTKFLDSGLRLWSRVGIHNQKLEFIRAIPNYMDDDIESVNWALLVYWHNQRKKC